jgi:hypothetical protein
MSTSRTAQRLATILFLLAALLLLKPVFGQTACPLSKPAAQTITTAPASLAVVGPTRKNESALTSHTSNRETDRG